jgi:hypothetical protein
MLSFAETDKAKLTDVRISLWMAPKTEVNQVF